MSLSKNTTNADVKQQYDKLCREIEAHNYRYYTLAEPVVSDQDFDALMLRLQQLEAEHPELITPESPAQRVGGAPTQSFETVAHAAPMLSIDNTYNEAELRNFDARIRRTLAGDAPQYVVELKIDGVSVSLRYIRGTLARAATRGDGVRGDDITANVRTIRQCPLILRHDKNSESTTITVQEDLFGENASLPDALEVRGEIYMTTADLERLNDEREIEGLEAFRNPRNTTAGTLKLLDPKQVAKRRLRAFFYDIVEGGDNLATHSEVLHI